MSTVDAVSQDAAAAEIARVLLTERSTIARLREEIGDVLSCLSPTSGQRWQSAAQRAYAARLDDLRRLVQAALGQLADAVAALDSAIARVGAGGR